VEHGEEGSYLVGDHFRLWMIDTFLTHERVYVRHGLNALLIYPRTC
jgi:hypothetical protein